MPVQSIALQSTAASEPLVGHSATAAAAVLLVIGGGELFTTGVEWIGARFELGQSATGSAFAALATAMPELLIPVLAVLEGSGASVGVGAILGGPITLTTLALFVLGASALVYARRGRRPPRIDVDAEQSRLDLQVFLAGFSLASLAAVLRFPAVALAVGLALPALYLWYLSRVVRRSDDGVTDPEDLELGEVLSAAAPVAPGVDAERRYERDPPNGLLWAQIALALAMLLVGSHLLIDAMEWAAATVLPVPTVIVALLVAPVVSNLPENVDGIIWVARGRDDLAIEQLTGVLAFQGTVGVAVGALFTPWSLTPAWGTVDFLIATAVGLSLVSGAAFYLRVRAGDDDDLRPRWLVAIGLYYGLYLFLVGYYAAAGHL